MFANVWNHDQCRALAAGLGYVLLYALMSRIRWRLLGRMFTRPEGGEPLRLAAELVPLLASLGYPFAMLLVGVFSPTDIGLRPADGTRPLTLVVASVLATGWLAVNWGTNSSARNLRGDQAPRASLPALVGSLPAALQDEFWLATCRAVLIPVLGTSWGIWVAPALRMLVGNTSPLQQYALRSATERRLTYLDMALDWVSSAILALAGSLWLALGVRAACRVLLHLISVSPTSIESGLLRELPVRALQTTREPLSGFTE